MLYNSLIAQVGEERAALGNYPTPIFALVYGVVLLGELITPPTIVGLALIIGGAEITLRGDGARHAGGKARAHEYRAHPPFHQEPCSRLRFPGMRSPWSPKPI